MGGEKSSRAWYTLFMHVPSSLGNLHTTEGTEHTFFSTHTREAGNEANDHSERVNISVRNAADLLLYV